MPAVSVPPGLPVPVETERAECQTTSAGQEGRDWYTASFDGSQLCITQADGASLVALQCAANDCTLAKISPQFCSESCAGTATAADYAVSSAVWVASRSAHARPHHAAKLPRWRACESPPKLSPSETLIRCHGDRRRRWVADAARRGPRRRPQASTVPR